MNVNVGILDRVVRAVIGAVFVLLYLNHIVIGVWGTVLLIVGIVLLLTAMIRFCPIYQLFGLNSCPK